MTKGMTKPMTNSAAPVEQLARQRLGFRFELRAPVAKRLERKPPSLTILSLIQIALTPRLVVRAPKDLAVTLARPSCVRHLFLLTLQKGQWEQIAFDRRKTSVRTMDAYLARLNSLLSRKNSLLWLQKFPVPLRREFCCKLLNPRADQTRKSRWMA
jgi:hypothetical protein